MNLTRSARAAATVPPLLVARVALLTAARLHPPFGGRSNIIAADEQITWALQGVRTNIERGLGLKAGR